MESQKVRKSTFASYRQKPVSSIFNMFWTPVFTGVTTAGLFTNPSKKMKQKKPTLNLVFGYPLTTIPRGGFANSSRQVGTQTARLLVPQETIVLGCVEWEERRLKRESAGGADE
jgi:hypothetical protein